MIYGDINKLNENSDFFIIELDFHDPYVITHGPFYSTFVKVDFDNSDMVNDKFRIPSKRRIADAVKDAIETNKINPPFITNNINIDPDNIKSLFIIHTLIYGYNKILKIPGVICNTTMSCIPNGKLEFNYENRKSYIIKSNNRIIDRDVQVRTPIPNDEVEDYGEE